MPHKQPPDQNSHSVQDPAGSSSRQQTKWLSMLSEDNDDLNDLADDEERLYMAIAFGKIHKVSSLLTTLRHTEVRDSNSCTPLLHTARNAHPEHLNFLVKLLIQKGSDVNAQDKQGMTAMMHLIRRTGDSKKQAELDGKHATNPGPPTSTAVDALRTLMRCPTCDPDVKDAHGNTALMFAAKQGSAEAVAILLFLPTARTHADVNARNNEGLTALDVGVRNQQALCCQMLVEEGKADTTSVKDVPRFQSLCRQSGVSVV